MDIVSLFPVLTLILGWTLNEVGSSLRLRREHRRSAGPLLTDLLEVRHDLIVLHAVTTELGKKFQIPPQAQLLVQQYIRALIPEPPKFLEKYEEAISTLARADPIRAFRLRGQPLIGPFLAQLRGLAASDEAASGFWISVVEPELLKMIRPHLDQLILDLARVHGWLTWWNTHAQLRKEVPSQSDKKWISDLLAKIKKAGETATQP